jgi:L-asparaginase
MDDSNPHVHLLATGGTIANPPDVDGYMSGEQLVSEISELDDIANVTATDVASLASQAISPSVWFRLHEEITKLAESDDPPAGFVVTSGSNSVEETGYFLNLTLSTELPVVLTAAQRNHSTIGNDGDRNLVDAVRVAAAEESRGRGAMVVLNDEIQDARDATKAVSGRPDAWTSANLGVLGQLDKRGEMRFHRRAEAESVPDEEFTLSGVAPEKYPTVKVIYSHVGAGPELVDAAGEHADGVVVTGFATGSPASSPNERSQEDALERLAESGIPVVMTHRGLDGWPYHDDTFIWGNTLTPQKAAILLSLALLETKNQAEIQRIFETY